MAENKIEYIEQDLSSYIDEKNLQKLTPDQKKTIWEWTVYLGKVLIKAIINKLFGTTLTCFSLLCFFSGCINIYPTFYQEKYWEGHYMNTNDFYQCTKNITLKEGESIWVLSNDSLKKVLENLRKK